MVHSDHSGPTSTRETGEVAGAEESGRSFVSILALLVRRRGVLLGLPMAIFVVTVGLSLLMPKEFTAQSRFLPETDGELAGNLMGLAAQFGLPATATNSGESLDFYGQLIRSHELLTAVIRTEYEFPVDEGQDTLRGDLIQLYDIDGDTPEERLKAAKTALEEDYISVSPYRQANILLLRTRARWPALAEEVNRRILTLVNEFNLERRKTKAAQERDFLEDRFAEVRGELRAAEEALQAFVDSNRQYLEASSTALQYARLQRQVRLTEQMYSSVVQALEQAQVDAIRNTPVITVVDRPEGTALKTAPSPLVNGLLGLLLGLGLAIAIVLSGEVLDSARRTHPGEYSELQLALRDALGRLSFAKGRSRSPRAETTIGSDSETSERTRPVVAKMGGGTG